MDSNSNVVNATADSHRNNNSSSNNSIIDNNSNNSNSHHHDSSNSGNSKRNNDTISSGGSSSSSSSSSSDNNSNNSSSNNSSSFAALANRENTRPLYRTYTAPVPDSKKVRFSKSATGTLSQGGGADPSAHEAQASWGKIYVDVTETEDAYVIYADLPGCDKKDIQVLLKENVLQLRAERRRVRSFSGMVHRSERFFGQISRALLLPTNCRTDAVVAKYEAGVLVVSLQKTPSEDGAQDCGVYTGPGIDADIQSR